MNGVNVWRWWRERTLWPGCIAPLNIGGAYHGVMLRTARSRSGGIAMRRATTTALALAATLNAHRGMLRLFSIARRHRELLLA